MTIADASREVARVELPKLKLARSRQTKSYRDAQERLQLALIGSLEPLAKRIYGDEMAMEISEIAAEKLTDRVVRCVLAGFSWTIERNAIIEAQRWLRRRRLQTYGLAHDPPRPQGELADSALWLGASVLMNLIALTRRSWTYLFAAAGRDASWGWKGHLSKAYLGAASRQSKISCSLSDFKEVEEQAWTALCAALWTLEERRSPEPDDVVGACAVLIEEFEGGGESQPSFSREKIPRAMDVLHRKRPQGGYRSKEHPQLADAIESLLKLSDAQSVVKAGAELDAIAHDKGSQTGPHLCAWLEALEPSFKNDQPVKDVLAYIDDLGMGEDEEPSPESSGEAALRAATDPPSPSEAKYTAHVLQSVGGLEPEESVVMAMWQCQSRAELLQEWMAGDAPHLGQLRQNRPELMEGILDTVNDWMSDLTEDRPCVAELIFSECQLSPTSDTLRAAGNHAVDLCGSLNDSPQNWEDLPPEPRRVLLAALMMGAMQRIQVYISESRQS